VQAAGVDFFGNVNTAALGSLDDWVPTLHPTARKHATGAWRVTSKDLGRNLEEDLAYHPDGIRDHGEECGMTPIDAVQRYGDAADPKAAAMWLCRTLGIEPSSLGWQGARFSGNAHTGPILGDREHPGGNTGGISEEAKPNRQKGQGGDARRTQAQVLIEIATGDDIELFHSPDGTTFADIIIGNHRETWATKSSSFRRWLRRSYYKKTGGAPNSESMSTALALIEANAQFDGVTRPVYLRVAAHGARWKLRLSPAEILSSMRSCSRRKRPIT
jgi:hypothetical protein